MDIIKTEEFQENGLPYIKETYSNGTSVTRLNTKPETEPETDIPVEDEAISKSELDEAYAEGVNSIG